MPNRPITDLLLCVDAEDPLKYHSRKMVCKLRDIYQKEPLYAFYREFSARMYTQEQKNAEMCSFLINALHYNN
jgi:hypothetical protein